MSLLHEYNFEDGTSQGWSTVSTDDTLVEVSTDAGMDGTTYGMRRVFLTQNNLSVNPIVGLGESYTELYAKIIFRIVGGSFTVNGGYTTTLGFRHSSFNIGSTPLLTWTSTGGGTWSLGSETLEVGVEYSIQIHFVIDSVNGGTEWWLNDELIESNLDQDTSGVVGNINAIVMFPSRVGTCTADTEFHWDEVKVSDSFISISPLVPLPRLFYGKPSPPFEQEVEP